MSRGSKDDMVEASPRKPSSNPGQKFDSRVLVVKW